MTTTKTIVGQCDHCGQDLQMFDSVPEGMPGVFRALVGSYIHTSGFFACNPYGETSPAASLNGEDAPTPLLPVTVEDLIGLLSDVDPRIDSQWDEGEGL